MTDLLLPVAFLAFFLVPAGMAFVRAKRELIVGGRIFTLTFALALFAYTALAAGVLLTSWLSVWRLPIGSFSGPLGAMFLFIGATVYLVARFQLRSFRMTWGLSSDRLITSGIYSFVRHPQNLGWGLLLLGVALLGRSGAALLLVGVYVLACVIWLPVEETSLQQRFGEAYDRYRACTPALIPFR